MKQLLVLFAFLLGMAGKVNADTYTTVYDIASTLEANNTTYQNTNGTIAATSTTAANAPSLYVNAFNGKLGNNGESWAQINANTVLVLPGVPKGATITFSLYNNTALTINGTSYTNGQTYTTTSKGNVMMTCTVEGYIKSITVVGDAFSTTYTTVYDIAASLSSTYEGGSGTLAASSAETGANAPELQIDATSGKLGVNNTDWAQINEGTILTLTDVPNGTTLMFSLHNTTALTINGNVYTNGGILTTTSFGNVSMTCTTSGYIKSITVIGLAFNTQDEPEEDNSYTNTWYFGKSNGAEEFALESTPDYTYTVNEHSIVISTNTTSPRGKLNNANRTDQWAQCNNGTIFKVPVFKGAKLSWGKYSGGSTTGFTIGGKLYNDYYVATADGTVNMSATGISYISYIKVEPITMYEITGSISGGSIDGTDILLTANGNGEVYTAAISSNSFTMEVPADTYNPSLSSNSYVISSPASVTVSEAGSIGTITIIAASPQVVTGAITNAPAEAFTLTFTGANHTETVNCNANDNSFTTSLNPDTYTISSSVGTLSPLSVESFTVVGSATSHNIYFPEAAVPAATSADITVDNTLAAASANNYKTVTDALAAAKAGNISNPVITLTSGQTYQEQVIVDMANVTLKTSREEKATITWYYGIGYTYYSLNSSGYYDKDRANTRNSILMRDPDRWGATVLVKSTGSGFYAENIIFENSFNQRYTTEEVTDGVTPNGVQSISYNRTLASGVTDYKAADSKAVTERAAALAFENNPTGCELYNCILIGSQDTYYTSGKIYVKNCDIQGNTDYIFGGGDVVFDNCNLVIGGYSDQEASAYITANNPTQGDYYIFRDCTVTKANRTYYAANLGRDWGGTKAGVYFFNLKNEIGDKMSYKWSNMGGAVTAGTANLHIYDFDPTINSNYNTTGSTGANVNGVLSDNDAKALYTGVVTRLGFTPKHIYEDMMFDENSVYNPIHIAAYNGGTGSVVLTRTINAGNWSTICLPFNISATDLGTALGTTVTLAQFSSFSNNTLNFTSADAITANVPCMIKVSSNVTEAKTINNVTIVDSNDPHTDQSPVRFQGVYSSTKMNAGDYFVSGNMLYKATASTKEIKPFRAYFTNVPDNARLAFFDDEATGIATMSDGKSQQSDAWYTINGVKLDGKPTKSGLYIVNRRKVTIK